MRSSKKNDCWRHVNNLKGFSLWIKSISIFGVEGFKSFEINFSAGISIICGRNGSGKTTLLKIIYKILSNDNDFYTKLFERLAIDNVTVDIHRKNAGIDKFTLTDDKLPEPLEYFDPSELSLLIVDKMLSDSNVDDWLEGIDANQILNDNLDLVRRVTGKNYTSVDVFEVSDILGDDKILPFISVDLKGNVYSNESMGQGEHKILLMLWKIFSLDRNSLFLFEEPEAFICPKSQMEFMDVLAHISSKNYIQFIISSHSEHILSKTLLNSNVLMLDRPSTGFTLANPRHKSKYLEALGLFTPKVGCILVEDDFAKKVLSAILVHYKSYLLSSYSISIQGGDSDIKKLLKHNRDRNGFKYLGVFDADCKGQINEDEYIWPIYFLPGVDDLAPEKLVINDIKLTPKLYADSLGIDEDDFVDAISLEVDHHDFFIELSEKLKVNVFTVQDISIRLWVENYKDIIKEFVFILENQGQIISGEIDDLNGNRKINVGSRYSYEVHRANENVDFSKLVGEKIDGYVQFSNGVPVFRFH